MPDKHALLSPSSADRWTHCPPSARLEAGFPQQETPYTTEGTRAHKLAEIYLKAAIEERSLSSYDREQIAQIQPDPTMEKHAKGFREYCLEVWAKEHAAYEGTEIFSEQELDLAAYVPESFGTADGIVISDTALHVIDLKYGQNRVQTEDNPQLLLYALGAYNLYSLLYDIQTVTVHIYQPNIDHIDSVTYPLSDVMEFAEKVKAVGEIAFEGKGVPSDGPWCHYCKAKPVCNHTAQKALSRYKDRKNELLMTPEEVAEVLPDLPGIIEWAKALQDHALASALKGEKYAGWKVIQKAGRSCIIDKETLRDRLADAGFAREDYMKPQEMRSMTDLKKLCGKDAFADLAEGCLGKPKGAMELVPESDKRKAVEIKTAAEDFEEELKEEND